MKKFFLYPILLISFNLFSQEQANLFEGTWGSKDSDYISVITHHSLNGSLNIMSFSFINDDLIEEKILEVEKGRIITKISNPANGWEVTATYKMLTPQTLLVKFEGENYNSFSLFYKMQIITSENKAFVEDEKMMTAQSF